MLDKTVSSLAVSGCVHVPMVGDTVDEVCLGTKGLDTESPRYTA